MGLLSQALVCLACGSQGPGALEGTEELLRVGVDPSAEADAIEARLYDGGYRRRVRLDGETHSSLAMEHLETGETAVRIVTKAGLALAVEAPADTNRSAVGILDLGALDLDGDGAEEVAVFAIDPARARRCIAIVRIDERWRAREVPLDTADLGGEPCIEAMDDVDGDGRPEAIVVVRYPELSMGTPPQVALPYAAPRWTPLPPGAARAFAREQSALRRETLATARQESDVREAYRIGVELAAIARFAGESADAQVHALRSSVEGLTLSSTVELALERVGAFIRRGWRTEAEAEADAEADGDAGAGADAGADAEADAEAEAAGGPAD